MFLIFHENQGFCSYKIVHIEKKNVYLYLHAKSKLASTDVHKSLSTSVDWWDVDILKQYPISKYDLTVYFNTEISTLKSRKSRKSHIQTFFLHKTMSPSYCAKDILN